jgi:ankyrin repeat protein
LTPLHCFALFNAPKDIGNILMSHPLASKALTMANAHGSTPLHIAVASPNISIETIQVLGTMDSAMTQDRLHRTPLHVASQNFHASAYMIRSLIKINPLACNKQSSGGYLPIHLSVHSEAKVDVVRELYDSFPLGLERESVLADTPLHKAASNNAPKDVADFLIEHNRGAIYKENHMGDLPLHCATASGASTEMVQTLVMVSLGRSFQFLSFIANIHS